jgi:hypothetical protein
LSNRLRISRKITTFAENIVKKQEYEDRLEENSAICSGDCSLCGSGRDVLRPSVGGQSAGARRCE